MSSRINPKDIINKQKEKYADSPWSKFLLEEFDKSPFEELLNKLIDGAANGNKFSPPIKSWFDNLSAIDPKDIKVVVISQRSHDFDLAFTTTRFKSREELTQEGVLFYDLSRTLFDGADMVQDWRLFNIYFINHLISTRTDIIYVFLDTESQEYAGLITEDHQGCKIFLPHASHPLWKTDTMYKMFNESINALLISKEIDTINW